METTRSLIAFVGMRDPYPESEEDAGPLLSLLLSSSRSGKPFHEAWLLCTGGTFLERGRDLEREAKDEGVQTRFYLLDFPVRDVIDYAEIWAVLGRSFEVIRERAGSLPREWAFLLDSGTPQMKTSLFLAARSGLFPAALLQGIPPRFAGGTYKVREVSLEGIPEIRLPSPAAPAGGPVPAFETPPAAPPASGPAAPGAPIGSSPAFLTAMNKALAAARYEDPVLVLGETGTGKTMIARRVHEESPRRSGPFVEVNCSAIPESLAESELFGHARGAFSGAEKARSGKFRAAHGGTLFLDEIGDLTPDLQAKLLKALEDRAVTPVGSDEPFPADARLVAATNRDLPAMMQGGRFRRDLYERLKVVVIALPPLRERREDIRPLAERFLSAWNARYGERRYLSRDALALLEAYAWPGNIRELDNALRSAACSAATDVIAPESLPDEIRAVSRASRNDGNGGREAGREFGRDTGGDAAREEAAGDERYLVPPEGVNLKARLLQVEWEYVAEALRTAEGNRETAAKLLGMTGHAFRKALRERLAAFADEGWEEGM